METKDKKDVVNYIIETHDFSPITEGPYWDEINGGSSLDEDPYWVKIGCKKDLEEARAEYVKQLANYGTLRIVQETRTVMSQFYDTPKIISEINKFEQGLKEVEKHIPDYICDYFVVFFGELRCRSYVCDIPIMNDKTVTELSLSDDDQIVRVQLDYQNTPLELSSLSIEDQIIIFKAVYYE